MKKIGIVGCGIRGRLYQRALATVGGLAVAGMCDPAPSAREAASRQFDGPVLEHHEDVYALGLDAVIVATPDFAHREAAVQAAEAGLALMVEGDRTRAYRDGDRRGRSQRRSLDWHGRLRRVRGHDA